MNFTAFQNKQHRVVRIGHDEYPRLGTTFGECVNVETLVSIQAGHALTAGPIGRTIKAFHLGIDVDQKDVAAGSHRDRFLPHKTCRVNIVDLDPTVIISQCMGYELLN